jgi:hypothetical protein
MTSENSEQKGVGDYFFEFPASRGLQGGTVVLMMTVPARTLARVLASDNMGSTLERSQREINPARAKKFYQYLVSAYEKKSRLSFRHWLAIATQRLSFRNSATQTLVWFVSHGRGN